MKILIIRFSSIGDIVLTTPVIRCVKTQLKDVEVHYLTKSVYKEVIAYNPYIDKLHLLNDDFNTLTEQLKEENFDCIIDLHHNLRTLRVKRSLKKIKSFSFNKLNFKKWLLTAFKIKTLPDIHIVDRYMQTVQTLGVRNDGNGLDYFISRKDEVPLTDLPVSHLHGYIAIVIGAAHNTKKLPQQKLKELCAKIDHPIILLGGKEDKINGDDIAAIDDVKIYNACGKFTLNESAYLVRNAKFVISHDTGLMHIAAAYKKIIFSVWGNTVPQFGMAPYYGKSEILNFKFEILNLSCRPCSKIGNNKCPRGHFKCMQLQNMQSIANKALPLLTK